MAWAITAALVILGFFGVLHIVNHQGHVAYTGPCHFQGY